MAPRSRTQTPIDPHAALLDYIARHGSLTQAAQALGLSVQYLSDIKYKRRPISQTLLGKLGLRTLVVVDQP